MEKKELAIKLYEIGAVQFGRFTLKSGIESPVYFDIRRIVSYPKLLSAVADLIWRCAAFKEFDLICGVPYTALPIATAISLARDLPMILRRKERKGYGTGQVIEGVWQRGQCCLVVEDLITSGQSTLETIAELERVGLIVQQVAVLLDREQGGAANLARAGYHPSAVFTLHELLNLLETANKIEPEQVVMVTEYIKEQQVPVV